MKKVVKDILTSKRSRDSREIEAKLADSAKAGDPWDAE